MKFRKMLTLAVAGTAVAGTSLLGVGMTAAYAADQPVTFEVAGGTLAIAQTPTAGTALVQGTAVDMPVTTVTDGRAEFDRTGSWVVSASVTNLTESGGATILADQITLDETVGSFTAGTGTRVAAAAVVATGPLVSATGDSINSVFTYTPTALLAAQTLPFSGSYAGTVTQTVV
ncbi:MAG: hypothetical protein QOG87_2208 [Actinomycetota bacterium]|jgi:hypothetical protein